MKLHSCLCKIERNRISFENQSGIKTVWKKIGFLKIGVSKIIWKLNCFNKIIIIIIIMLIKNKCENWNFGNWKLDLEIGKLELNLEIGILKKYLKMEF